MATKEPYDKYIVDWVYDAVRYTPRPPSWFCDCIKAAELRADMAVDRAYDWTHMLCAPSAQVVWERSDKGLPGKRQKKPQTPAGDD